MSDATSELTGVNRGEQSPLPVSAAQAAELSDWFALLKPRVMTLVVFTGLIGLLIAPGHLNPVLAFTAVLCIAVAAGACGAINMWYDRDIDAVMHRTRNRPIPAGRIEPGTALGFGVTLAVGAVIMMGLAVNFTAATVLALSIAFYVFVYTMWLKRRTPQNIVIGGAAGAIPPLVGYAAVTGRLDLTAWTLFLIIFYWTPPHFWALALLKKRDYGAAGVPMAPLIWGEKHTKDQMLWYLGIMVALSVLPFCTGAFGVFYLVSALAVAAPLAYGVVKVRWGRDGDATATERFVFMYSLLYLALLYAAMVVDLHVFR
jgi:heme o synthase